MYIKKIQKQNKVMKWEEHVGVHMKQIGHVLRIVEAE